MEKISHRSMKGPPVSGYTLKMGRNNMGGDCVCECVRLAVSEVRAERGESAGGATLLKSHKAGGQPC